MIENGQYGVVTASADEPYTGTRITVTVKPDSGYELDELTVTDAKGKDVKVTKRSEATYTFQMPDSKVTVEAAFAKEGTVVDQPLFSDVSKNDYFHDAVEWAVDKGITSGTSATTFSPNTTVTRGQTVTFLWRAAGSPAASGSSFSDVSADAYYAQAVAWVVKENIAAGTSASTFSPDAPCTRAQIVAFLYRDER